MITNMLLRNDFHILNMARGFEDLAYNILRNALVQASDVQSSLIGLGAIGDRTGLYYQET